jgi:Ca2+-binding RTX toxin-like protein
VRSIGGVAAAFAALAVGAPASLAATPAYDPELPVGDPTGETEPQPPRKLAYVADPGPNQLSVSLLADGSGIQFTEGVAAPVPACTVSCSFGNANVESLRIDLGGEDDAVSVQPGVALPPALTIDGGDCTDRADASQSGVPATISGVEHASGGAGADLLTASPEGSILYGQDGTDTLVGGDGSDRLDGGAGDDTIRAADGIADVIACGAGEHDSAVVDVGPDGPIDVFDTSCENMELLVSVSEVPTGSSATPSSATTKSATTASATVLPVQVLAPGIAAPRDLKAPAAYLRSSSRQRLSTVLKRGLLVPIGCAESCGVSVNVLLARKEARRLDLAGRTGPAVIGTGTTRLTAAGRRTLRVRLTQNARRALGKSKSVAVTLQVLVSDAAGNATLLQRRVSMRG